ncbi:branched-chain amino acid aminotransferase [Kribbella voronezhensis]|uniref:Branched-chain amino acid aminotransferase n=1 Tax=Kribbella voronezhensis TaxID=2512212 RepID=A0A4R7SZJ9_9ACTN|nr:aminotransferase class IV [Kribbella voronezhensis]TDU84515.1 branched-chain amino acid aminotransferase [Kribbella voronezhensis]
MKIWLNGVLQDPAAAGLSPLDHGLTTGDGVFETVKIVDGQPFAVSKHLDRLVRSATGLGLPAPDRDQVERAIAEVVKADPDIAFGRLRITYTGGVSPLSSDRGSNGPTLVVATQPIERPAPSTAIVTVPWVRNERSAVAGLKTTSYAENVRALAYAKERGGSEAIFANTVGDLCEGTGSNIFCVYGGELVTPTLESGALAGVTRALVIAWFGAVERDVPLARLAEADEIFLTSTTRDVQAVHRCDARDLSTPGEVTAAVAKVFAERSAEDVDP